MNKGFTLVELLAVLFVLGIITIVTVPSVITTNQKSVQKDINEFHKTIENAAEVYVETHQDLKKSGTSFCVNVSTLEDYGLLSGNLQNPDPDHNDTVDNLNASVDVKKIGSEITYTYKDSSC